MANSKRVAFWVLTDEEGDESVIDEKTLFSMKLDTVEKQRTALGIPESEEIKEVWIKKPLGEHKYEIQSKCLDANTMTYNPALENRKRFVVLVEKWNGFPLKPSEEAYLSLPVAVANFLDGVLIQMMMPSAFNNAGFMQALKQSQADLETKNESL